MGDTHIQRRRFFISTVVVSFFVLFSDAVVQLSTPHFPHPARFPYFKRCLPTEMDQILLSDGLSRHE